VLLELLTRHHVGLLIFDYLCFDGVEALQSDPEPPLHVVTDVPVVLAEGFERVEDLRFESEGDSTGGICNAKKGVGE
jgi:hypothetical protein